MLFGLALNADIIRTMGIRIQRPGKGNGIVRDSGADPGVHFTPQPDYVVDGRHPDNASFFAEQQLSWIAVDPYYTIHNWK
jgi:hypothetical protein